MFSLQKLLGKHDEFFELLCASAEEGLHSVHALRHVLAKSGAAATLDEFIEARRKDKMITAQLTQLLVTTFVTALEREDIQTLANALYKVPKATEKFAERYLIFPAGVRHVSFETQVNMLEEAMKTVIAMLHDLKKQDLARIAEQNNRLQRIEGDADKLMVQHLRDIYKGSYDPLVALALKDLYEILEKAFDRCRDAGNVMAQVVLKT